MQIAAGEEIYKGPINDRQDFPQTPKRTGGSSHFPSIQVVVILPHGEHPSLPQVVDAWKWALVLRLCLSNGDLSLGSLLRGFPSRNFTILPSPPLHPLLGTIPGLLVYLFKSGLTVNANRRRLEFHGRFLFFPPNRVLPGGTCCLLVVD